MSELRKANTDYPYFLTMTVVGWADVFTRSKYCDVVVNSLQFCIENKGLEVYAYVIMSNHLHMVARHGGSKLNEIIRDFKSFTAKEIIRMIDQEPGESRRDWLLHLFKYHAKNKQQHKTYQFWQKTSHPTELSNAGLIDQKIDYIHNNPLRAGLVTDPCHWMYSSANIMSPLNVMAI